LTDKRSINIIGNILMLLSLAFIVNRIIEYQIDFRNILSVRVSISVIISIIIYALVVLTLANIFYALIKLLSGNGISKNNAVFIYCKANLYKYLPGNVFHYIGRNQIAVHEDISHGTIAAATIAEMLFLTLAAVILVIVFAGQYAVKWSLDNFTNKEIIMILVFIVISSLAAIILYNFNLSVKEWVTRYTTQISHFRFAVFSKFVITYIITFILNGAMFIVVLYGIGGGLSKNLILPVIGMYAFSWIIGFVTPGAPAGLGIREAIMSALLIGMVEGDLVITAVVLYRIVTTLGDVTGFIIAHHVPTYN